MKASNVSALASKHGETQHQETGQLTLLGRGSQRQKYPRHAIIVA